MTSLARRRFDHLATELSVALGVRVPRHALWLASAGHLDGAAPASAFCCGPLDEFLRGAQLPPLDARARRRLRRAVERYDPARRAPEEILAGLFRPREEH
jgi:hypothetical protein